MFIDPYSLPIRVASLLLLVLLTGCGGQTVHEHDDLRSSFCDGKTITAIRVQEHSVWGNNPSMHSGGYRASLQEDCWIQTWSLEDFAVDSVSEPTKLKYLGRLNETLDRNKPRPESHRTPNVHSEFLWPIGLSDSALYRGFDTQKVVDQLDQAAVPGQSSLVVFRERGKTKVLTRSRRHMLVCDEEPRILSLPALETVRTLSRTETFNAAIPPDVAGDELLLTDDLQFIVSTAHREAGLPANRPVLARCYDLEKDETITVKLAESFRDRHLIGVHHHAETGFQWLLSDLTNPDYTKPSFVVLNPQLEEIHRFQLSGISPGGFPQLNWLPEADLILGISRNIDRPLELLVFRVNLSDGVIEQAILKSGVARVPMP